MLFVDKKTIFIIFRIFEICNVSFTPNKIHESVFTVDEYFENFFDCQNREQRTQWDWIKQRYGTDWHGITL